MDVVYIYKMSNEAIELKYSLRSLKNLNIEVGNVFIVGTKPKFLNNVIHIPCNDPYKNKQCNAIRKIMKVCKDRRLSEDFILMNDDFFFLKPQDMKIYTLGDLSEARQINLGSKYGSALRESLKWLKNNNLPTKNYEVHYPIIYNKDKFRKLFKRIRYIDNPVIHRSIYGNYYNLEGEEIEKDFKKYRKDQFLQGRWSKFISTDNHVSRSLTFKRWAKLQFKKRSPYERKI